MIIPFSPPDIEQSDIDTVVETLSSGWITTGPKTKQFEVELSLYCGTEKTVCLNSATACMEVVLRLLGIGQGDEVITSAYTYSASASVIAHVGATIRLVDVKKDSFFMDEEALQKAITSRTKAIIPVDIGGVMCDYASILKFVEEKQGIFVPASPLQEKLGRVAIIADAAHSLGAVRDSKLSGNAADFTCFSFHAVKNLTTAEGGAVTWRPIPGVDNSEIYNELMLISLHGQSKDALEKLSLGSWEYDIVTLGYKCNMTDVLASLGLAQLKRYHSILKRRSEIVARYDEACQYLPLTYIEHKGDNFASSLHLYLVRVAGADVLKRNQLIAKMAEHGVAVNVHYKPLPLFTAYRKYGFDIKDFPNAYAQYQNEVTLPLYSTLADEQVEYVLEKLRLCLEV